MKRTYKLTILVVAFLFSLTMFVGSLKAAELVEKHRAAWLAPTKRVDGTALPATAIKHYELFYGAAPEALKGTRVATIPATQFQYELNLDVPGKYCYKIRIVDTDNREGPFSPESCLNLNSLPVAPVLKFELVLSVEGQ